MVLASCLIILATLYGIRYSFGVFFKSLETEFGWTRATISTPFSLYIILAPLFAILGGWASDKHGPKPVAFIMGIISGLSLFLTRHVESVGQLYISYSFLLALGTGPTYTLVMSTGSRWFIKYRATALGIIGTGASLGTVVIAPVTAWLISLYDWYIACSQIGIIASLLVLPSALMLKKDPKEIGIQPDGKQTSFTSSVERLKDTRDFSLREALKSRNFWLFFLIWFSYSFCLHMVMSHVIPRIEDLGISPLKAAAVLSVLSGISIPSRVLIGRMADRLNKRIVTIFLALLHTVAMFWLIGCTQMWMFYLFSLAYGLAYGGIDPPITALIAETFELGKVGTIMGTLVLGWGFGAAISPYMSGVIFDLAGSYQPAFLCGGLIMILAAICVYRLKTPQKG